MSYEPAFLPQYLFYITGSYPTARYLKKILHFPTIDIECIFI